MKPLLRSRLAGGLTADEADGDGGAGAAAGSILIGAARSAFSTFSARGARSGFTARSTFSGFSEESDVGAFFEVRRIGVKKEVEKTQQGRTGAKPSKTERGETKGEGCGGAATENPSQRECFSMVGRGGNRPRANQTKAYILPLTSPSDRRG